METVYKGLKILIGILLAAVIVVGAVVVYNRLAPLPARTAAETTGQAANPAPDFTVYDEEGNPFKLSDFQGKPVVLNFWASWCGPCKSEMPDIQEFYEAYGDEIHFLIVNLTDGSQETVESASGYIAGQGYTFPVYYDTAMEAAYAYGVNAIPATWFVDGEGNILDSYVGAMSQSVLQQKIALLLGNQGS